MEIPSQITVSLKPDMQQAVLNTDLFKPGGILRLKILELHGDRALVDFGKFRTTADVKIPVALGEELLVKVQETGAQVKLNLLRPDQIKTLAAGSAGRAGEYLTAESFKNILADLKPILNQAQAPPGAAKLPILILNVFKALNLHFESFDLSKLAAEIALRLKAYLENSGVFFEKHLERMIANSSDNAESATAKRTAGFSDPEAPGARDLKANLLILKNFAEDEPTLLKNLDSRSLATLRAGVDALLTDIAAQQGRAVKQLDSTEPFQVFNYALPLKDAGQTGGLKIYYQKQSRTGAKKGFQISLLLSMDRLGELRTDFFLVGKDLTVTFFVTDRHLKTELRQHDAELQELLRPFFDQLRLQVVVSEKKINAFADENVYNAGDRRVDLRV